MAWTAYKQLESVEYTEKDHETWAKLYERQLDLIGDWPCKEWREGFKRLNLPTDKVPDQVETSNRLEKLVGWKIFNAEDEFLNADQWFTALEQKTFPATTYIRKPQELDFTPYPDLFHEYFGHLPLIATPEVAEIAHLFAQAYFATPKKIQVGMGRLWWHAMEWSFLKEDGEVKAFGAGIIAGKDDFQDAIKSKKIAFNIFDAFNTVKTLGGVQEKYFVHESISILKEMLVEYVAIQKEGESFSLVAEGFDYSEEIDDFKKSQRASVETNNH